MSNKDWFRNTTWNNTIAATFEDKLRRARGQKAQYLRIQAFSLAETEPEVGHLLLDRYFEMPTDIFRAQAFADRATAFLSQGRIDEALQAYEAALAREAEFPHSLSQAYVDLPYVIATRGLSEQYFRAREVLNQFKKRIVFPVHRFKWNTAHSLIAEALNESDRAYIYATAAIAAAGERTSGIRNHPKIGLVGDSFAGVLVRLQQIPQHKSQTR